MFNIFCYVSHETKQKMQTNSQERAVWTGNQLQCGCRAILGRNHKMSQNNLIIAELQWPEGPPNGAPYPYRNAKETHALSFSWLSRLAVLLCGHVYTTMMTTMKVESRNMVAILQLLAIALAMTALLYSELLCHWTSMLSGQLTPDKSMYLLTSVM